MVQLFKPKTTDKSQDTLSLQLDSVNSEFYSRAQAANISATVSKAHRQATEEYTRLAQQRVDAKEDKNGNPTFGRLPQDIETLGKEVKARASSRIEDPAARRMFEVIFDNLIKNQTTASNEEARSQQINFIRAEEQAAFQAYTEAAVQSMDSNVESEYFIDQYATFLEGAQDAFSSQEITKKIDDFEREVRVGRMQRMINKAPDLAVKMLEGEMESPLVTSLTAAEKEAALDEAIAAWSSFQAETTQGLKEMIIAGDAGQDIIELEHKNGTITDVQAQELNTILKQAETARETKRTSVQKVAKSLIQGQSLVGLDSRDINDHFEDTISRLTEKGEEVDIAREAELASLYQRPVTKFNKRLASQIVSGDPDTAIKAVAAYNYLQNRSPASLDRFSTDARAIASYAVTLQKNASGISPEKSVELARAAVTERSTKRIERLEQFKDIKKFKKLSSIKELVQDHFNADGFLPIDIAEEVEDGVASRVKNILKESYIMIPDEEGAFDHAMGLMKDRLGQTLFNGGDTRFNLKGGERIMYMPPEKVYPGIQPDKLLGNFESNISTVLPEGIEAGSARIQADDLTLFASGPFAGSYGVTYLDKDGVEQTLLLPDGTPVRWKPDLKELQEAQLSEAREKAETKRKRQAFFTRPGTILGGVIDQKEAAKGAFSGE